MNGRAAAIGLLLLATLGCTSPRPELVPAPVPEDPGPPLTSPDAELHHIIGRWWPAKIARDSVFFRQLLAPEFVQRPAMLSEDALNREGFVQRVTGQSLCNGRMVVQERGSAYHLAESQAAVNVSLRIWFGDPVLSQTETESFFLFVRRGSQWQLLDLHEVSYQLPGELWEKPATSWDPMSAGNPGRAAGPPILYALPRCES